LQPLRVEQSRRLVAAGKEMVGMIDGGWRPYDALIDLALAEDIGAGDVTTAATIPAAARASGVMLAKAAGVVSGMEVAAAVVHRVDPMVRFTPLVNDGDRIADRQPLAEVEGLAASLLIGERTALNLVQRLSAVATLTARFVAAVAGTNARIVDTRKTTPGLRWLEKAAVRHGGGANHRFNLADGVLIKDNHLAAVGGADRVARAVAMARARAPHGLKIEVEVTTLAELEEALAAGADIVLLDNMDVPTMAEAVRQTAGRALLEASGGVTLERARAIAETGVDLISVGALTHSAGSLDISLEFAIVP
jgi:nicotinate-nucleotide pyrophosphorylase (carboxylating)